MNSVELQGYDFKHGILTRAEECALVRRYQDGDLKARDELVSTYLRFVVVIAQRYTNRGTALADLVQEGLIGLLRGLRTFDTTRKVRVLTYCHYWCRVFIAEAAARNFSVVRFGTRHIERSHFIALGGVLSRLEARHPDADRDRIYKLAAQQLRVTVEDVRQTAERLAVRDASLDVPVAGKEGAPPVVETIPSEDIDVETQFIEQERRAKISSAVEAALVHAAPHIRYVVEHRIMAEEPMSLTAIGARFSVSRQCVHLWELSALALLRKRLLPLARELELVPPVTVSVRASPANPEHAARTEAA
jgi:RNA polymerase sigma-32 factor